MRKFPSYFLAVVLVLHGLFLLVRCGDTKRTNAPDGGIIPADWDGASDYLKGTWRFEEP
jgi:hypothetical protein